ncbi:hypothetical protein AMTR_s00055p00183420 [Amborella trichopoda]|uniref:Uncharacterized protein n=1 Tax=Amborella trichopoda TaxID=13333 RepID=U5DD24_AMBTC|nr:hypothetical protein AMTR_s00055p00183420 [Amborella trichopoda]
MEAQACLLDGCLRIFSLSISFKCQNFQKTPPLCWWTGSFPEEMLSEVSKNGVKSFRKSHTWGVASSSMGRFFSRSHLKSSSVQRGLSIPKRVISYSRSLEDDASGSISPTFLYTYGILQPSMPQTIASESQLPSISNLWNNCPWATSGFLWKSPTLNPFHRTFGLQPPTSII